MYHKSLYIVNVKSESIRGMWAAWIKESGGDRNGEFWIILGCTWLELFVRRNR